LQAVLIVAIIKAAATLYRHIPNSKLTADDHSTDIIIVTPPRFFSPNRGGFNREAVFQRIVLWQHQLLNINAGAIRVQLSMKRALSS
jgi:hypothetical protein